MNTIYLSPVVGALIGYCTNWLAIKMVFRPHEEKRIFGLKVPFTPGLIAVERNRITDQIGYVVSNHLLTDDDVKEKILELDFDDFTRKIIENIESNLVNSDLTFDDLLKSVLKDDYDNKVNDIKNMITEKYVSSFEKTKTEAELIIFENDIRLIAPELLNIVKTIFEDDMYDIDELLKSFFDNIIADMFSGLGALFGGFISSEKIYQSLKSKIITSIENEPEELENKIVALCINSNESSYKSFPIDNAISVLTKNILSIKLSSLSPIFETLKSDTLISSISNLMKIFLSTEINSLIAKVDIKDLIVKKMNEMPLIEIENLILTIAKKEITAITNVGGVLGFIIGLLSIIFY